MAIKLSEWLSAMLGRSKIISASTATVLNEASSLASAASETALLACVGLIGGSLSKCEFLTLQNGDAKRANEWYLWNVSPNKNQSATAFRNKLIYQLLKNGEALVVDNSDGDLLVADSYTRNEFAHKPDEFTDVTVGELTMSRGYTMPKVLYFKLPDGMKAANIDGFAASYAQMLASGVKGYRQSQGMKGTLEVDAAMAGNKEFNEAYTKLQNEGFKKFTEADSAIMPLYKGMKFNQMEHRGYTQQTSRDIRAMVDDIFDYLARLYCVPPTLINGAVQDTESAWKQYLSTCASVIIGGVECEINRKRYDRNDVVKGTRLSIDMTRLTTVSWVESSAAVDKLVASGALSVNEVRRFLGLELIDEEWANAHYLTKNYGTMEGGNVVDV